MQTLSLKEPAGRRRDILYSETACEEDELLRSAQAGDKAAFSELVRLYQSRMRSYCFSMVRNEAVAEEAAQEVFLKAYKNLRGFRNDSKFSTWLYRIANNHCIDLARRKKIASFFSFFDKDQQPIRAYEERSAVQADVAIATDSKLALEKLLAALPSSYRSILVLREAHGLSYQELADSLNCSVDSVKSRLKRARKKALELKQSLDI